MPRSFDFDLIVVGAGIVGLAHALAAARRGRRVLVIDRDAQANGASIRNFGFVTITGQERGPVWNLARRSAAIWRDIAEPAGIAITQTGLLTVAQRPEAAAVLQAFLRTEMGEGCDWLDADALYREHSMFRAGACLGSMRSRDDLRVESRTAIPLLATWLEHAFGVTFLRGDAVIGVEQGRVSCAWGSYMAASIVVCPGDDLTGLFPDRLAAYGITCCKLQMMRLADPGWRLPSPVMSDLSLVRYLGYSCLPESGPLSARIMAEQAEEITHGIHLIVVQSADGSLVVGDSHDYSVTPHPFAGARTDELILAEYARLFGHTPDVIERWTGSYASAGGHHIVDTPAAGVRIVIVTSGTGASTAFALAEDVIDDLFANQSGIQ